MQYLILVAFAVCFIKTSALFSFGGKDNKHLAAIKECAKDKTCATFCVAQKFNITTKDGKMNLTAIPYHHLLNQTGLTSACIQDRSESDNCEKMNNMKTCLKTEGLRLLKNSSKPCIVEFRMADTKFDLKFLKKLGTDKKYACFNRCMLLEFQIINLNNQFQIDDFERTMRQSGHEIPEIKELVQKCADKNKQSDECIQNTKMVVCIGKGVYSMYGLSALQKIKSVFM